MRIKGKSILPAFFMIICLFAVVVALNWDWQTGLLPIICGGGGFLLSFFQLVNELKETKKEDTRIMDTGYKKDMADREILLGGLQYLGWLMGVYLGTLVIGLYPSLLLFIILYLQASRKVSVFKTLLWAAVTVGVVYIIINQVAQEMLPDPWIYELLFGG